MEPCDDLSGTVKLTNAISNLINRQTKSPPVLDFGVIQGNFSLLTDTFSVPIPKGDYSVCRSLTIGKTGNKLTSTGVPNSGADDGAHSGHESGDGKHGHSVLIPEKMRSLKAGDRVLVAWIQNEAVVVDIVERS